MDSVGINKARIVYYGLFSSLFSFCMGQDEFANIVKALDILSANPIDEQSEKAFTNMKRRLEKGGYIALKNESDRIFYNPTTTFVPMTASYYIEKRDDGTKRMEMLSYVLESKFRRNTNQFKEHEDHIEFVLLFMQKLINEELQGDASAHLLSKKVFATVLNGMIDEFGDNLFNHEKSYFYKQAALALRSFIDFERLFHNIARPAKDEPNTIDKPHLDRNKRQSKECIKLD